MPAMGTAAPSGAGSTRRRRRCVVHVRQQRARHTEQLEQFVVPAAGVDVVEQRARGVAGVGDVGAAAAEAPRHPVSTVPKASSASARPRAPGMLSSSHRSLVPEKYGSIRRPVLRRTSASAPAPRSSSQYSAVRLSCHTMAGATGTEVARSQITVVSRWLAMPRPATAAAGTPAFSSAPRAVANCARHSSSASCSTQPGCGVLRPTSCWALDRTTPEASITSARPLVVPVSSASTSLPLVTSPMPTSLASRASSSWCVMIPVASAPPSGVGAALTCAPPTPALR